MDGGSLEVGVTDTVGAEDTTVEPGSDLETIKNDLNRD